MGYMMSGTSRRGLGFSIDMNSVYSGDGYPGSDASSGIGSDITSGLALAVKSNAIFSEGLLGDIESHIQNVLGDVAAGASEDDAGDQINTQGASDEQIQQQATDTSRDSITSKNRETRQTRDSSRRKQGVLTSGSDSTLASLRRALDQAQQQQSAGDKPVTKKRRSIERQTTETDEKPGIPSWVWLVSAGAVVFAVYGRKK